MVCRLPDEAWVAFQVRLACFSAFWMVFKVFFSAPGAERLGVSGGVWGVGSATTRPGVENSRAGKRSTKRRGPGLAPQTIEGPGVASSTKGKPGRAESSDHLGVSPCASAMGAAVSREDMDV